eukprot:867229-Amorphochlora_amoeboformis.AAC.1
MDTKSELWHRSEDTLWSKKKRTVKINLYHPTSSRHQQIIIIEHQTVVTRLSYQTSMPPP